MREFSSVKVLLVIRDLSGAKHIEEALLQALSKHEISGIFDLTYHPGLISDILHRTQRESTKLVGIDLFPQIAPLEFFLKIKLLFNGNHKACWTDSL